MIIQDAIKSGKPFFRRTDNFRLCSGPLVGVTIEEEFDCYEPTGPTSELYELTVEDVLATDWEVKE